MPRLDMQPAHQSWKQTGGSNTFDGSDDSFILNPSIKQGIKAEWEGDSVQNYDNVANLVC